jgi:hypothetical protein
MTRYGTHLHDLSHVPRTSTNPPLIIHSMEVVKWVTSKLCPFAIVEDEGFVRLMKTGWPHIKIPSKSTVARDVRTIFQKAKELVTKYLGDNEGWAHISTDAWRSPNNRAFIALVVHIEVDREMKKFLLDFIEVPFVSDTPYQTPVSYLKSFAASPTMGRIL